MYLRHNKALFCPCLVNLDVDSCWLSVIIMSVISITFGSEMDFAKKRAKHITLCKCFMDMLINGVQTATILLFLNQ